MRVTNSVLDRVERVDRVEWICMFDTTFNQMLKKAVVLLVASLMSAIRLAREAPRPVTVLGTE